MEQRTPGAAPGTWRPVSGAANGKSQPLMLNNVMVSTFAQVGDCQTAVVGRAGMNGVLTLGLLLA